MNAGKLQLLRSGWLWTLRIHASQCVFRSHSVLWRTSTAALIRPAIYSYCSERTVLGVKATWTNNTTWPAFTAAHAHTHTHTRNDKCHWSLKLVPAFHIFISSLNAESGCFRSETPAGWGASLTFRLWFVTLQAPAGHHQRQKRLLVSPSAKQKVTEYFTPNRKLRVIADTTCRPQVCAPPAKNRQLTFITRNVIRKFKINFVHWVCWHRDELVSCVLLLNTLTGLEDWLQFSQTEKLRKNIKNRSTFLSQIAFKSRMMGNISENPLRYVLAPMAAQKCHCSTIRYYWVTFSRLQPIKWGGNNVAGKRQVYQAPQCEGQTGAGYWKQGGGVASNYQWRLDINERTWMLLWKTEFWTHSTALSAKGYILMQA